MPFPENVCQHNQFEEVLVPVFSETGRYTGRVYPPSVFVLVYRSVLNVTSATPDKI